MERYLAEAIAWSVRSDFEFIRWLVDIKGFPREAIENDKVKSLYDSAARTYARLAPSGKLPSVGDVLADIETTTSKEVSIGWAARIEDISKPSVSSPIDIANNIVEEYESKKILGIVEGWLKREKHQPHKLPVRKSFTEMSDEVASAIAGTEATGRPRNILEENWASGANSSRTTGYSRLDKALDGGWTNTDFHLIGMPSGHGKSSLACNFSSRQAELKRPVIINSFEMTAFSLLVRMICDLAEVGIRASEDPYKNANEEEFARVMSAMDLLDKYVRVYDDQADNSEIERRVRRHKIEFGESPLVIVDHIGIVRRERRGSEWSELEDLAYGHKDIAKAQSVPVVSFAQVPGDAEKELLLYNEVIHSMDYRGSRGLRNALDYGMMGCRHNGKVWNGGESFEIVPQYRNHTVIQVTKNRKTGVMFWGAFYYVPEHYRLTNMKSDKAEGDRFT